jgi:hypothetical protein
MKQLTTAIHHALAPYLRLDWSLVESDGGYVPLWYACIDDDLVEDLQYHITEERDGFWLTGEHPDWVDRKARYDTLEQAQAGAHDHLVRWVLRSVSDTLTGCVVLPT